MSKWNLTSHVYIFNFSRENRLVPYPIREGMPVRDRGHPQGMQSAIELAGGVPELCPRPRVRGSPRRSHSLDPTEMPRQTKCPGPQLLGEDSCPRKATFKQTRQGRRRVRCASCSRRRAKIQVYFRIRLAPNTQHDAFVLQLVAQGLSAAEIGRRSSPPVSRQTAWNRIQAAKSRIK